MYLRVFRAARGEYLREYRNAQEHGWRVLSVRRHDIDHCWLLRCVRREWFDVQPTARKIRIAQGGPI